MDLDLRASCPPPRTPRQRHADQTRTALRDAAYRLFASVGYAWVTVDQIAAEADVSRRTFFRYFPTKEAVLFASQQRDLELFEREVRRAEAQGLLGVSALRAGFRALVPIIEADREVMVTRQSIVDASPALSATDSAHDREWERAVYEVLERGGWARDVALLASGAVIGATNVALREWRRAAPQPRLEFVAERALNLIEWGLASQPARGGRP